MAHLPRLALCALVLSSTGWSIARAATERLTSGRSTLVALSDFQPTGSNWQTASGLAGDPRREKVLVPVAGQGLMVNQPDKVNRKHLFSAWEHGDLEVDLEFLLPPGANSGVYLMGRYEVQLLDSWKVRQPKPGDSGGIYERWDASRGKGKEEYDGVAPRTNAARAPGLWQRLQIVFQAPRFDAAGVKTQPAKFVRVVLNGTVIHENVVAPGPTRSAAFETEAAWGPLMIQGDHGSLALRSIHCQVPVEKPVTPPDPNVRPRRAPAPILVDPTDRVLVQRGFVPWDPSKRIYACSVGTPAGLHFAYDFETGALLRVWRGGFVDTAEMWENRGERQVARPTGAALDLSSKPSVALLEQPLVDGWPATPGDLFVSDGYRLEADGTPVFLSRLHSLTVEDRLVPTPDQSGFVRTVVVGGRRSGWPAFVLLAEADSIREVPGGFVIGDRSWYLDWPEDSPHRPVLRTVGDRQLLVVPVTEKTLGKAVVYTLVW
jgi:hypothetical protein